MDAMLRIACWNVRGLNSKKVQDNEFLNIVNKFDIVSLVESWTHKDSPIDIPGFCHFHAPGKKVKKRGRRSGGIIIYFRDQFQKVSPLKMFQTILYGLN